MRRCLLTTASARGSSTEESGAANCPGFFPGAGNLGADPHVVTPVHPSSREVFETEVFVPFRTIIRGRSASIMSSHFAAPALTGSDTLPATLSPEITRILREDLGYQGILMTDSMGMGGIARKHRPNEAAALAVKAGNDILMGTFTIDAGDHVAELVEKGEIPLARIRDSVRRILAVKARLGLHENRFVDLDAINLVVGNREHRAAADAAAEGSIVLLRDAEELVPISKELSVLSITYEREDDPEAGEVFDGALRGEVARLDAARISPESEASDYEDLLARAARVDRVVLSIYIRPQIWVDEYAALSEELRAFARALDEAGRGVVVIDFGKLTTLEALPDTATLLMAWSEQHVMQRAAARALLGR